MHDNLKGNMSLMLSLMRQPLYGRSVEYFDNRISLFSIQKGKCSVTGSQFQTTDEIHCHHIVPRIKGGSDSYDNLTLICEPVHRLIHATQHETIVKYLSELNLTSDKLRKVNSLREKAGLQSITRKKKITY